MVQTKRVIQLQRGKKDNVPERKNSKFYIRINDLQINVIILQTDRDPGDMTKQEFKDCLNNKVTWSKQQSILQNIESKGRASAKEYSKHYQHT